MKKFLMIVALALVAAPVLAAPSSVKERSCHRRGKAYVSKSHDKVGTGVCIGTDRLSTVLVSNKNLGTGNERSCHNKGQEYGSKPNRPGHCLKVSSVSSILKPGRKTGNNPGGSF